MPHKGYRKRFCKWGHDTFKSGGYNEKQRLCSICVWVNSASAVGYTTKMKGDYYVIEEEWFPDITAIPNELRGHSISGKGWPADEYLLLLEHEVNNLEREAKRAAYIERQRAMARQAYKKEK